MALRCCCSCTPSVWTPLSAPTWSVSLETEINEEANEVKTENRNDIFYISTVIIKQGMVVSIGNKQIPHRAICFSAQGIAMLLSLQLGLHNFLRVYILLSSLHNIFFLCKTFHITQLLADRLIFMLRELYSRNDETKIFLILCNSYPPLRLLKRFGRSRQSSTSCSKTTEWQPSIMRMHQSFKLNWSPLDWSQMWSNT